MDLRLLDDIVRFLEHDNLTNRYDQFILAGASLGAVLKDVGPSHLNNNLEIHDKPVDVSSFYCWQQALFQHLDLAIALHQVQDVYIIEHEHCGAYQHFLKEGDFEHDADNIREWAAHHQHSTMLSGMLMDYMNKLDRKLNVHCFMMDLVGNVELLHTTAPARKSGS